MRAVFVVVSLAAGCGRMGFGTDPPDAPATGDAEEMQLRVDAPPPIDADPAAPDAQAGSGTYTVTESSAPYASPVGATPVPGFADGADDENFTLALPFTFAFYGVDYTSITISVNGFVAFGPAVSGAESYANDCPID